MKIAYVRVSTVEQNEARQIEALKRHSIDRWFIEKVSGKDMDRQELQKMLDTVQSGDTVYIHDFSRLARSTKDLLDIVERFQKMNIHLVSDKENLDTNTPTGKLMLTMIAAINKFERQNMLDRQKEGIEVAKRNGVYKGRKPTEYDHNLFDVLHAQVEKRRKLTSFAQTNKIEYFIRSYSVLYQSAVEDAIFYAIRTVHCHYRQYQSLRKAESFWTTGL